MRALPRRQAQVVALFYVDDRSVADIALVLECAEGTVKAHLHKARGALAVALDPDPDLQPDVAGTGGPAAAVPCPAAGDHAAGDHATDDEEEAR